MVSFFFFSSRRRHTRFDCDWSSDVCSSDLEVYIVQGRLAPGGLPVKLFFDRQSGLLVRLVHYADTAVGRIPTQVDYEDYRDVAGIKMPFKLTRTWTDGRSIIELRSVELNVPIDAAKFAKPAPPAPPSK